MMSKEEFLKKYAGHLNEEQIRAVLTVEGPVLLLAVPGSGKTTVLVHRLGYMLYVLGIPPENILTLTYTVAATRDMSRRFLSIFGEEYADRLEFRTINGICSKILFQYWRLKGRGAYRLLSEDASASRIVTDILRDLLPEYPTDSDVKGARTLITYCKNMLYTRDEIVALGRRVNVPLWDVYRRYNQTLKSQRMMDFDDQLVFAYEVLRSSPDLLRYYRGKYQYLCVDEAQDTSKVQHCVIDLLAGRNGNLFMVGDEDQSIYGFRAAYPEALLNFEEKHIAASVLVMNRNYRSTPGIIQAADRLIGHNEGRYDKHMVSVRGPGADVHFIDVYNRTAQYTYLAKVASDCTRETAVLYRDNESALPLFDLLDRLGTPCRIKNVDMTFFSHRVVQDVINILKFALDPCNTELFMRIYYKFKLYIRKAQALQMCQISAEEGIPVLKTASRVRSISDMVQGKCDQYLTYFESMRQAEPGKALYLIENPCGYGEYLDRNHIDRNKLFVLRTVANREETIESFLSRLSYLQEAMKNGERKESCPFILSTIHSSKGLEYDRVYLMDICDGVFPMRVPGENAPEQALKTWEEERRLCYVGMTRAKNDLYIFKMQDQDSCFIREMSSPARIQEPVMERLDKRTVTLREPEKSKNLLYFGPRLPEGFELFIGERVVQVRYGHGVVSDVDYDGFGNAGKFTVTFDSGGERVFSFPKAFQCGMSLEGESRS